MRAPTMTPDRELVARELAILAALNHEADPVLASLISAIYLEDLTGVVLSDSQIAQGLSDPGTVKRVMTKGDQGS
jgi:hypothetical protein